MSQYLDLEVSLLGIKPRIWRRFLITPAATFMDLHEAIQGACGWRDYHLYEFREAVADEGKQNWPYSAEQHPIARSEHVEPDEYGDDVPVADEVDLESYFTEEQSRCYYVYDFGDYWEHLIELKQVTDLHDRFFQRFVDGARAFPPEDCGGIPSYEECCEALEMSEKKLARLADDAWDEIVSRLEWLGDWRPENFDPEEIRKRFDR